MGALYFDISDIVDFARVHNHVSGIQRVQQRVIAALAEKHGDQIICTYKNPATGNYCQVPANGVFSFDEFDSIGLLVRLGARDKSHGLNRGDVKQALQKYNHRKKYRALKKVEIYISALLAPGRLKKLGVRETKKIDARPLPGIQRLLNFPTDSTLVFLGANWNDPTLMEMGKLHRSAGGRVVQMIYDLIPHTAPQYFKEGLVNSFRKFLFSTPEYVTDFACISDWTQKDVREYLLTQPGFNPRAATTALAHEFAGFPRNATNIQPEGLEVAELIQTKKFVLCVGTIEVRKNGTSLLRAWQQLIKVHGKDIPQLVFAGKFGWKIDDFHELLSKDRELARHVTIINSPSDHDLASLYEHCLFSAYPSFYEGWGLPVGESAWFGRFCLASDATSIPEVCRDLIDYVAPEDIKTLVDKITFLLDNPEYVKQKELALMGAPLRTWRDVADSLYTFITETPDTKIAN